MTVETAINEQGNQFLKPSTFSDLQDLELNLLVLHLQPHC
jgi:hypothetical protein